MSDRPSRGTRKGRHFSDDAGMRPWATYPSMQEPTGLQPNPGAADFISGLTGELPVIRPEGPGSSASKRPARPSNRVRRAAPPRPIRDTRVPVEEAPEDPSATRTLPALRYPAGPERQETQSSRYQPTDEVTDAQIAWQRRRRAQRRAAWEAAQQEAAAREASQHAHGYGEPYATTEAYEYDADYAYHEDYEYGDADAHAQVGTETEQPEKKSAAYNSFVMFVGTLVSRVLGLVRSPILLAAVVGLTSQAGNAFNVANKLPNLIYMIIVGGIVNAVLVPQIVRAMKRSDDGGQAYINKLLTIAIVGLGAVTVVITAGAPFIVKMMAATMDDDWYHLTVQFAYWCLPQVFFYGMYTVMGQVLNARESFGPYMWAPALNNVVAIAGFLAILAVWGPVTPADGADPSAWTAQRVGAIGGISTLGIAAQAIILVWPLRASGIRFRFDFRWRGSGLGAAGRASWWMALTMLVSFIPTAITSNVAAGASARAEQAGMDLQTVAGNFAYDTAYTIYSIPTSLFVVSIATAVFTRMSSAVAEGEIIRMREDVERTLKVVSTIMFLCSVGLIVLSVPISRIFALTSAPQEAVTLARVVAAMSIGLTAIGAVQVLDRVYYAFEDTRGAFWVNLPFQIAGVVGFFLCGFLPPQWVVVGVGVVMSATNIACTFVMLAKLSPRVGGWNYPDLLTFHLKLAVVSVSAMLGGFLVLRLFGPLFAPISLGSAFGALIVGGVAIVGIYLALMAILRMDEVRVFWNLVRKILSKLKKS
ncbi:murein biosynthesis integral membrane protein MurJ [Actinobaculum suis]|uniref:murein biosynthesis integral membrane protein MurJ n=1 Tax=Actinobaculum suis TaxID=1657 RepID=UPI001E5F649F|nr:murein biosynthesis integral membrane protein MurJ [Actinobaculum suis]